MADEVVARVRERMVGFGFPGSLLPDCMEADEYDERTGKFTVRLAREVTIDVDGIPVWYDKVVSGVIKNGSITQMSGVKAKKGFWLGLGSIEVEGGHLVFKVAGFSKKVPLTAWSS